VALCSRDEAHIAAAADSIVDTTGVDAGRVLSLACDVTDEDQIERAIEQTVDRFGGLHILLTNAGGPPSGNVDEFDAEDWRDALELNLMSTINLCRHALPHLRTAADRDRHARILMVSSISAKQPIPGLDLSNTSRAGVQGFAKSLANELGPEGITVNTLLPGYTRTERLIELAGSIQSQTGKSREQIEDEWAEDNALKRIGTPEEFAAAVAFLASARASYVTGVAFPVDGGRSKHVI
jgi:3-oxoacyl-[acyl-carrier protein] reductase